MTTSFANHTAYARTARPARCVQITDLPWVKRFRAIISITSRAARVLGNSRRSSGFPLMRVRFGDFTFDGDTRELLRGAAPVHLSPKAFRFLELLLESRPRALSKGDLQEKIWPSTFVSEENLASLAAEVREAICEEGRSARFVRTVYGFGYAFAGEAADAQRPPAAPPAGHLLVEGKRELELSEGENIVGRGRRRCRADRDDPTVSRHHAASSSRARR